jgi:hypothetical protein
MIRIVVGGAVSKKEIADKVKELGGDKVSVEIKSDIDAAIAVKSGKADYYLGACVTGGGGALAMAIAILTYQKCAVISASGRPPQKEEVEKAVKEGKLAFGFANDHIDRAVSYILEAIFKNKETNIT